MLVAVESVLVVLVSVTGGVLEALVSTGGVLGGGVLAVLLAVSAVESVVALGSNTTTVRSAEPVMPFWSVALYIMV